MSRLKRAPQDEGVKTLQTYVIGKGTLLLFYEAQFTSCRSKRDAALSQEKKNSVPNRIRTFFSLEQRADLEPHFAKPRTKHRLAPLPMPAVPTSFPVSVQLRNSPLLAPARGSIYLCTMRRNLSLIRPGPTTPFSPFTNGFRFPTTMRSLLKYFFQYP